MQPYGNLAEQAVQRFENYDDLAKHKVGDCGGREHICGRQEAQRQLADLGAQHAGGARVAETLAQRRSPACACLLPTAFWWSLFPCR